MANLRLHVALVVLIVFSCLAYGGVTPFSFTIIQIGSFAITIYWLCAMVNTGNLAFVKGRFYIPLAAFIVLVMLQILPLPLSVIRFLSGTTFNAYRQYIPQRFFPAVATLSIYPDATMREFLYLLSLVGIFCLVINITETKRQFDFIINSIIVLGFVISIFGMLQKYAFPGRIYWFSQAQSTNTPFGPFVNRNNFAGYINMIIPFALGYYLTTMPSQKRLFYGIAIGIMSLALFLSFSRAGVGVYFFVFLVVLSLSRIKKSLRLRMKLIIVWFFLACAVLLFFVDFGAYTMRFISLFQNELGVSLGHGYSWIDLLRIIADFPLFGTGFGTFRSISALYKSILVQDVFIYAHNDLLQLVSETGAFGFIMGSSFFVAYLHATFTLWLRRRDSYVICLVCGGLGSIVGVLMYSFFDFNLHIPANALLFFVIMGLVYRLACSSLGSMESYHSDEEEVVSS